MSTISQDVPSVPGLKSKELLDRRHSAVPRGVANMTPLFSVRGSGAELWDVDGNRYIDFAGGIGTLNVGHGNAEVISAVQQQVAELTHTCFHVTMHSSYVEVAEWLNRHTPGDFPKKTMLANSGAEAVENAVKIARAYTGRSAVIAFENAFHGRTMLGMSLTGKEVPYKAGFGPLVPDVYRIPYPDPYRNPFGHGVDPLEGCLSYLRRFFLTHVGPERVAAIIVEPVAGEGGFIVPPSGFLSAIADLCRELGIVFIVDEIQTGFGRTGHLFACEHEGVTPDLLLSAKSIAAGLPLSAVTGRAEIMDAPVAGGLGGTYGGNPVSCAAALQVFRLFEDGALLERSREIGNRMLSAFREWQERYELIGDVRGLGAMVALELVKDRATKEPAADEVGKILRECYEHGLIVIRAGLYNNVIRCLTPLVIEDGDLDKGLKILEAAIANVS